jgi:hypothetical protein
MRSETGDVFLYLLALSHPTMDTMYFVNNTVAIISDGVSYMAFPFDLNIPDDREDEITRIQLAIDNIDLRIVTAVRSIDTPAVFTLSIIRAAEPDVLIAGPFACTLRNVSYDALVVSGDLWPFEDISNEPYPQHAITPANFPGLFG